MTPCSQSAPSITAATCGLFPTPRWWVSTKARHVNSSACFCHQKRKYQTSLEGRIPHTQPKEPAVELEPKKLLDQARDKLRLRNCS